MSLGAVIGFSLCAAALCVLLRQYRPEIALVISILCGVGVLLWLLEQLAPVLEQLQQLTDLPVFRATALHILRVFDHHMNAKTKIYNTGNYVD